jgi:hypothetical protein
MWFHSVNWFWIACALAALLVAVIGLAFLAMDEALHDRTDRVHRAHAVH